MDRFGRLLDRGEIMEREYRINAAKSRLVSNHIILNPNQYGFIDVTFAFAIAGNTYQMFLIDFRPKCKQG